MRIISNHGDRKNGQSTDQIYRQKNIFPIVSIDNNSSIWSPKQGQNIGYQKTQSKKLHIVLLGKIPRNCNHTDALSAARDGIGQK